MAVFKQAILALALVQIAAMADARPRLNSSELTYQSACLQAEHPAADLVEICAAALEDPRLSTRDSIRLRVMLAQAQLDSGASTEAAQNFQLVLQQDPENGTAQTGLGWIHYERDDHAEAVARFQAAVDLRPTAEALAGLGGALYRNDSSTWERALAQLETASILDPQYSWAVAERGWVLQALGRTEAAITAFEEALALASDGSYERYWLAVLFNRTGDHESALEHANATLALRDDVWSVIERSNAMLGLGRNVMALRDANAAIEMAPDNEIAFVMKARALDAMGLSGAALEVYATLPEAVQRGDVSYYYEAILLFEDGQVAAAQGRIDQAIADNPDDSENWRVKAFIRLKSEDYDGTLAAAEQVLKLGAEGPWAHLYSSIALVKLDRVDEAMAVFAKAVAADLDEDGVTWFLSHLVEQGLVEQAKQVRAGL